MEILDLIFPCVSRFTRGVKRFSPRAHALRNAKYSSRNWRENQNKTVFPAKPNIYKIRIIRTAIFCLFHHIWQEKVRTRVALKWLLFERSTTFVCYVQLIAFTSDPSDTKQKSCTNLNFSIVIIFYIPFNDSLSNQHCY